MTYPYQPVQRIVADTEPFPCFDDYLAKKEKPSLWETVLGINGTQEPNTRLIRYPWLTPVLGSGCRESVPLNVADLIGNGVENLLAETDAVMNIEVLDLPASKFAGQYSRRLAADRLDLDLSAVAGAKNGGTSGSANVGQVAASMCLTAALATTLLHRLLSLRPEPHQRSGLEMASVERSVVESDEGIDSLVRDIGVAARTVREALKRDPTEGLAHRRIAVAIGGVLDDLGAGLDKDPMTIDGAHVQAAAELTWLQLSAGVEGIRYPGWGDLLQALSVAANTPSANRPLFAEIGTAQRHIRDRYLDTTLERLEVGGTYIQDDIAALLDTQSSLNSLVSRANDQSMSLPEPSVFVTSFDLELEMALWNRRKGQRNRDDADFIVAVPVHAVVLEEPRESYPIWLGCVVRPSVKEPSNVVTDMTGYRHESESSTWLTSEIDDRHWFVISGATIPEMRARARIGENASPPIVVRLSGSPLMALPPIGYAGLVEALKKVNTDLGRRIDDANAADDPAGGGPPLEFRHAVLLSEYDALSQNAAELFHTDQTSYGLPPQISGAERGSGRRFWLMLGVQMADVGIRSRLTMQIASSRFLMDADGSFGRDPSWRNGLAVNQRIGDVEQDLLYWNGFDVVTDDMANLSSVLQDFLTNMQRTEAHLRQTVEQLEEVQRQAVEQRPDRAGVL